MKVYYDALIMNILSFKILKKILLFNVIFISLEARGSLLIDVSIFNKKGIDIGLTLGSELHSTEEIHKGEDINLTMKSGVSLLLRVLFKDQEEFGKKKGSSSFGEASEGEKKKERTSLTIGPSSDIIIRGRVIGVDGKILKDFFEKPLIIPLGQKVNIKYAKNSQLVEIYMRPYLK